MMKNLTVKFIAAILIIAAAFVTIQLISNSLDRVVFARPGPSKNDGRCKTVTWQTTLPDKAMVIRGMALEPYYVKVVWPNGKVGLYDRCERKVYLVHPEKKTVRIMDVGREIPDIYADLYDSLRNFRDMSGYSIEQIGRRRIDQKQTIGFRLINENEKDEIVVWVDPDSQLPMHIEFFEANELGQMELMMIWNNIVFDVDLDESLFKLDLDGYEVEECNVKSLD
jgi:hypothetical protein